MSIESNLKTLAENSTRIANALEAIVSKLGHIDAAVTEPAVPTPPAAAATQVPEPPKQPAPPAAPAEVPTPPAASPAATAPAAPTAASPSEVPTPPAAAAAPAMTPEQLNAALVAEMKRLGSRDPIDNALKAMGVSGIQELPAERYAELLNNVKAL